MKKKILVIILGLIFVFGILGCSITSEGSKDYEIHSKLIKIEGEDDLYYYTTTHTVYIVFNEFAGFQGYGYMAPYYSNGKSCIYDTENKVITEIGE